MEKAQACDVDGNSDTVFMDAIRVALADGSRDKAQRIVQHLIHVRDAVVEEDLPPALFLNSTTST